VVGGFGDCGANTGFIDGGLSLARAARRAARQRLLTARGLPRLLVWMRLIASSLRRGVAAAGEGEAAADVAGGLVGGHAGHVVTDADALVESR
jgi:hypothetical protein